MDGEQWWLSLGDKAWYGAGALQGWRAWLVRDDGESWGLAVNEPGNADARRENASWSLADSALTTSDVPAAVIEELTPRLLQRSPPRSLTALQQTVLTSIIDLTVASVDGCATGKEVRFKCRPHERAEINAALRELTPRFCRRERNAYGDECYQPTLSAFLVLRRSETEKVINAALGALRRGYEQDQHVRLYGFPELGLEPGSLRFAGEVIRASRLHLGWEPSRWGVPGDIELLAEVEDLSAFLEFARAGEGEPRPWPTAAVRLECDEAPVAVDLEAGSDEDDDAEFGGAPLYGSRTMRSMRDMQARLDKNIIRFPALDAMRKQSELIAKVGGLDFGFRKNGGIHESLYTSRLNRGLDKMGALDAKQFLGSAINSASFAQHPAAEIALSLGIHEPLGLGHWAQLYADVSRASPAAWVGALSQHYTALVQNQTWMNQLEALAVGGRFASQVEQVNRAFQSVERKLSTLGMTTAMMAAGCVRLPAVADHASALVTAAGEVFRELDVERALSEEDESETRVAREQLAESTYDELRLLLSQRAPACLTLLAGARDVAARGGPDCARHFSVSFRELFLRLLGILAPHQSVQSWVAFDPAKHLHDNKVSRRGQLQFLYSRLDDAWSRFASHDIAAVLAIVEQLNAGTHAGEPDRGILALRSRFEGALVFLLQLDAMGRTD